jgi:hypothetical protein
MQRVETRWREEKRQLARQSDEVVRASTVDGQQQDE